jgi:hypothetical protein
MYFGHTRSALSVGPPPEVNEFFDQQQGQLELPTMFELLATTEAILKTDFKARVALKKKITSQDVFGRSANRIVPGSASKTS